MTVSQVAGGGLGAVIAGVLVQTLQTYAGFQIDLPGATAIVTALIAFGGWVAHGVDVYGLRGVLGRVWRGQPSK